MIQMDTQCPVDICYQLYETRLLSTKKISDSGLCPRISQFINRTLQ